MNRLVASAIVLSALALAPAACAPLAGDDAVSSDEALTSKAYDGTCTPGGRICAYFAPTDMPMNAVLAALRGAERSIRIATYNINVREITEVLRERMDRGVKVELLENFSHALEDESDEQSVWRKLGEHPNLTKYKASVLRGGNPQMHNKVIVVDGKRVFFGSANWTYTGLVGNFENVIAIRDTDVVKKFDAELDELRDQAKLTCEQFASPTSACGHGGERFSPEFQHLALEGSFEAAPAGPIDATRPGCAALTKEGLLIAGNQPRMADMAAFRGCFVDASLGEKYAAFVTRLADGEKYVDGTPVKADPPVLEHITTAGGSSFDAVQFKHRDTQRGPIRVYFSGEDDVEYQMIREMRALQGAPGESFAFFSTNFLTNSRLVREIAKLKDLGVYTRVFFDRGRFEDPNFTSQFYALSKLGFTYGLGSQKVKVEQGEGRTWRISRLDEREDEDSLESSVVSVFDNDLSGKYGANHNKYAVLGTKGADGKYKLTLINGSANWSSGAMQSNDENLVIIQDEHAASIYLREMISQMYVFRYAQREDSRGLQRDMKFVSDRVPCFDAVMGRPSDACREPGGAQWRPASSGSLVMAVTGVPAGTDGSRRVWAWVPNADPVAEGGAPGRAFELFSYHTFEGKWVTSIPGAPRTDVAYKFFTSPRDVDPNRDGLGAPGIEWEYGGVGNDRHASLGSRPLLTIRDSNLRWGAP